MQNNSIYDSIVQAKNGTEIPVLKNGKTIESRYNPDLEAQRTIQDIKDNELFFIVTGCAGGILIESILKKNKNAVIIAVEKSKEDFDFLKQIKTIKSLSENPNVIFCDKDNLLESIVKKYIPVFYGNLRIIEQHAWCMENREASEKIRDIIQNALKIIASDFATQSRFGKIWNDNIFTNLKTSEEINIPKECIKKIDRTKTALILAAGPSVDSKIKEIKENREKYYIIATDTAFSILNKNLITSDAVISIDGQSVSSHHFMTDRDISKTLFIFDLSANSSAVIYIKEKGGNILFSMNSHPLSILASNKFTDRFINLETGAGTVTIAALDFAVKCGFKDIKIIGADFSYSNGKPYAKSTYLDNLYSRNSSRINNTEIQFSNLMYRSPLIKQDAAFTTELLKAYKDSFEDFIKSRSIDYSFNNSVYELKNTKNPTAGLMEKLSDEKSFTYKDFISDFKKNLTQRNITCIEELTAYDISLLPLMSWLKTHENKNNESFSYFLNIAYKTILRYN